MLHRLLISAALACALLAARDSRALEAPRAAPVSGDPVAARARAILDAHVDRPWPDPDAANPETRAWGRATFALAACATGRSLATADRYLEDLLAELPVPLDESYAFPALFPLPLLWRLYLDPACRARLGEGARRAVEETMWRYVFWRSQVRRAAASQAWLVHMSENHDIMQKSSFLLAAQVLQQHPLYRDRPLADGFTPARHQAAWEEHLLAYIDRRALRGLTAEFASPTYGKYTLHAYANLADFAESKDLARRARDFVTLFWADVAQDYLAATGVRGGAQTRTYKNAYATRGTADALRDVLAMYGWHPHLRTAGSHPITAALAASAYRIPPLVTAIALLEKPPFRYASWRLGRGSSTGTGDSLWYTLEPAAPRLVRDSYLAPEFSLGAATLDPLTTYTHLNRQNRWMGAMLASHPNARIGILGRAAGEAGYQEINGVLEGSALIAGRSLGAENLGTDVFLSHAGSLWDHWEPPPAGAGWGFTRSGGAFLALYLARAPWVAGPAFVPVAGEDGVALQLADPWAPVVLQAGRAADYGSEGEGEDARFERFRASVRDNPCAYDGKHLRYVSEQGHALEFFRASPLVPRVDGRPKELNPALVYDSPYLQARAGEERVTIRLPGLAALVLPFAACAAGDADGDAVCGERDSCRLAPNPDQVDSDADGYGNACDADYDNDGATSGTDFLALLGGLGSARGQAGYREVLDSDASGSVDGADFLFAVHRLGSAPGPSGLDCAGAASCRAP